jgi:hypothetical protein
MPKLERITKPGRKRLVSVDGSEIRGVLSLGILRRIEAILKRQNGGRADFSLSHYLSGPSQPWWGLSTPRTGTAILLRDDAAGVSA